MSSEKYSIHSFRMITYRVWASAQENLQRSSDIFVVVRESWFKAETSKYLVILVNISKECITLPIMKIMSRTKVLIPVPRRSLLLILVHDICILFLVKIRYLSKFRKIWNTLPQVLPLTLGGDGRLAMNLINTLILHYRQVLWWRK